MMLTCQTLSQKYTNSWDGNTNNFFAYGPSLSLRDARSCWCCCGGFGFNKLLLFWSLICFHVRFGVSWGALL